MSTDAKPGRRLVTRAHRLPVAAVALVTGIPAFILWLPIGRHTALQDTSGAVLAAIALFCGSLLGTSLIRSRIGHAYAKLGVLSAVVLLIACAAWRAFTALTTMPGLAQSGIQSPADWATASAVLMWGALVTAWPIALAGLCLTIVRSWRWSRAPKKTAANPHPSRPSIDPDVDALPPLALDFDDTRPQSEDDAAPPANAAWARAFNVPEFAGAEREAALQRLGDPTRPYIGVCLSGGGVRAGALALGVLQAPRMRDKLRTADYLVSVSGGGYIAGAFQQALSDAKHPDPHHVDPDHPDFGAWTVVRDSESVLMPGTAEEGYVRRNASYLANTPGRLASALGMMAAHMVLTLGLVFAPAIALGVALGLLYANRIPADLSGKPVPDAVAAAMPLGSGWWAVGIAVALPGLLALICGSVASALRSRAHSADAPHQGQARVRAARRWRFAAGSFGVLAVADVALVIGLPALIGLSAGLVDGSSTAGTVAATSIWGVLATYAVSLVSFGRMTAAGVSKSPPWLSKLTSGLPGAVLNMLLVAVIVAAVVVGWLLLAGGVAEVTLAAMHRGDVWSTITSAVFGVALLVYAIIVGLLIDETSLSLHPFYRARLASAFAVRRVKRDDSALAVPYHPATRTRLSEYGTRPAADDAGEHHFPKVIFAASATLGAPRTPAGLNRVSYTFSGDWVGGPEVGYVSANALERVSPDRIKRDLTVQGAVAISGAAISASGGGQGSPWYGALFALSGIRLGAWLPNPTYVMNRYRTGRDPEVDWREPRIPRKRRIDYLAKELLGPHSHQSPMLQVTDGGFYDNLGLLELLRRRCTEIYAVDASGDVVHGPATLARTTSLAWEELGIRIDWADGMWPATAGSAEKKALAGAQVPLQARFSSTPVLVGTVHYPPECGLPGLIGTIRVARATLWPGVPPEVVTYAAANRAFPNDSTADQWFDDDDYRAYTTLGRCMGDVLVPAPVAATTAATSTAPAATPAVAPAPPAAATGSGVASDSENAAAVGHA